MVAAAKLRRAQDTILAARPYAQMVERIINDVASRSELLAHPLLSEREPKAAELVVLTSDRGLAGGFNSNVLRRASRFLYDNQRTYQSIQVSTIGRKGHDFFRRRNVTLAGDYSALYSRISYNKAAEIALNLADDFLSGKVDAIFLVYNEFISPINQRVVLIKLLPMQAAAAGAENAAPRTLVDFLYEPAKQEVLSRLVPQALTIKFYRALLESVASEHGARMSAMENATSNAAEMIDRLTLFYNRTRQAVITKELMEIVSGAEALK